MPMKRFNIWLDTELVKQVEKVGKTLGVRKTTYMRRAIVEKLRRDTDGARTETSGRTGVRLPSKTLF
jgi:hypothetical protein